MYYSASSALTGERDLAYAQVIIHRYLRVAPRPVPTWSIRASGTIDGGASPCLSCSLLQWQDKKDGNFPRFSHRVKNVHTKLFPMKSHTSVHKNQMIQKFKLQKSRLLLSSDSFSSISMTFGIEKVIYIYYNFINQYHDTTFI